MDDYSSLSVVCPIKAKSDVAGVTMDVINMLEKQSGWPLLVVRTDNGSEYINSTLATFFKDKGVLHQTTVRYTPEQNGKAERLNRTLLDRVRAMLEDSGLPKTLWAEAATTASAAPSERELLHNLLEVSTDLFRCPSGPVAGALTLPG